MLPIMEQIAQFLMCNLLTFNINNPKSKSTTEILSVSVTSLDKLRPIVDYFNKYPLLGVKGLNFKDFCIVADLIKNKAHLTEEGLEQIRQIKYGMNTRRK